MKRALILGMKRALNLMENCDGDLDFAIWAAKKDILALEAEASADESETAEVSQ